MEKKGNETLPQGGAAVASEQQPPQQAALHPAEPFAPNSNSELAPDPA